MNKITAKEAALVRKVLATTGYTAPMHERQEARRIVDRVLPPMPPSRYPGFSDWPDA